MKTVKVPTSWSDIPIGQFSTINKYLKKDNSQLDKQIKLISIVCHQEVETIKKIKLKQFKHIIKKFKFLETLNISDKIVESFWIKGIKYRFRKNLNHFTAEDLIDIMSYGKDGEYKNIHKILAIYCKPERWQFWLRKKKHKQRADIFYNNMSVAIALPIYVFFSNVLKDLLPRIEIYLERMLNREMKTIVKMGKELSQDTGVGSSPSTDLAMVTPQNGTPS